MVSYKDTNFLKSEVVVPQMYFSTHHKTEFEKVGYCTILKIPRAFFALLCITTSLNLFSCVDTILADNLSSEFKLTSVQISLVYAA